jgi:hypothetical protein
MIIVRWNWWSGVDRGRGAHKSTRNFSGSHGEVTVVNTLVLVCGRELWQGADLERDVGLLGNSYRAGGDVL